MKLRLSLVLLGLAIAALGISFVLTLSHHREQWHIEPSSGAYYWERMLNFWGFPVAESEKRITYVWYGVDNAVYFSVSKQEAGQAFPHAVKHHISELIGWMKSTEGAYGPPYDYYRVELMTLTGQDFGRDAATWQQWWSAHSKTFTVDPDAYSQLLDHRIRAEKKAQMGGASMTEIRAKFAKPGYRQFLWNRRIHYGLWIGAVVLSALGVISSLWTLFRVFFPKAERHLSGG